MNSPLVTNNRERSIYYSKESEPDVAKSSFLFVFNRNDMENKMSIETHEYM